jgi:serine O-acetyltransferase
MAGLVQCLKDDFATFAANRFEPIEGKPRWQQAAIAWRVLWGAESMVAVIAYRLAVWLRERSVPALPWLLDRFIQASAGLYIGRHVRIAPGVYFPHGNVVMDGFVVVGPRCVFAPFVTVGLVSETDSEGRHILDGPRIGAGVQVGTGAKLLGPIKVGDHAVIGANAVVLRDVPAGATAVGVPARIVGEAGAQSRGQG